MEMKHGTGTVKKVGERELAKGEGDFGYDFPVLASLEEVIAYFEQKDEKGKPINALTEGSGQDRVFLSADATITKMVNAELERREKANAYQNTVAKFRPAEDRDAAFERIVRTMISLGLPEEIARVQAKNAVEQGELAASQKSASTATETVTA